MQKRFNYIIFGIIFLAMMIPLVGAVPPVQTTIQAVNLQIAYPQYQYVPQNNGFELRIHVINATEQQTNITTSCYVDLYNHSGQETAHNFLSYKVTGDFEIELGADNFSDLDIHSFYIQCNNTNKEIGFANGYLM